MGNGSLNLDLFRLFQEGYYSASKTQCKLSSSAKIEDNHDTYYTHTTTHGCENWTTETFIGDGSHIITFSKDITIDGLRYTIQAYSHIYYERPWPVVGSYRPNIHYGFKLFGQNGTEIQQAEYENALFKTNRQDKVSAAILKGAIKMVTGKEVNIYMTSRNFLGFSQEIPLDQP